MARVSQESPSWSSIPCTFLSPLQGAHLSVRLPGQLSTKRLRLLLPDLPHLSAWTWAQQHSHLVLSRRQEGKEGDHGQHFPIPEASKQEHPYLLLNLRATPTVALIKLIFVKDTEQIKCQSGTQAQAYLRPWHPHPQRPQHLVTHPESRLGLLPSLRSAGADGPLLTAICRETYLSQDARESFTLFLGSFLMKRICN